MNDATPKDSFTHSAASVSRAARDGDCEQLTKIIQTAPEWMTIDCPYPWAKTVKGHTRRGSNFSKPIEIAAYFNQPSSVRSLLNLSFQTSAFAHPLDGFYRALGIAKTCGHEAVVQAIVGFIQDEVIASPERVRDRSSRGDTLLHLACRSGQLELVDFLLNQGAKANAANNQQSQPIHLLLDDGNHEALIRSARRLLDHGASSDLWIATAMQDQSEFTRRLNENPTASQLHFRPDRPEHGEGYPLVRACALGNQEFVEALLDAGADIDAIPTGAEPADKGMPIVAAVYGGHFELAEYLLSKGANAEAFADCAAPLADMLYGGIGRETVSFNQLSGLRFATRSPLDSQQVVPNLEQRADKLYEKVLAKGGRPSLYSHVRNRNYAAVAECLHQNPAGSTTPADWMGDTVFDAFVTSASWIGDPVALEICKTLVPSRYTNHVAMVSIELAIRSHNRDRDFSDYRKLIELNLSWAQDPSIILRIPKSLETPSWDQRFQVGTPLHWLADRFLEAYSYGLSNEMPTIDQLIELADLFLSSGVNIDARHPESNLTALAMAVREGLAEYVDFLLSRGASSCANDPDETNPMQFAINLGFTDIHSRLGE